MPVFKINIDREVTTYDRFTRYVEASDEQAALAIAQGLAEAANRDCPDDCADSMHDPELGDFSVNDVEPSSEDEAARDDADVIGASDDESEAA